ncbi:HEAT repeat-containing protein 3 [Stigmatopora nigra]
MGKSKTKKFKRPQFNDVGLPVTAVKEAAEEIDEQVNNDGDSAASELLEKLQSPNADIRECACAGISHVVQRSQSIPGFLQRDAVRRLGPMLLDVSMAVRETAAGALRNLSVCGGHEVCEDMVKCDVMTPLTALLTECSSGFGGPSVVSKDPKNQVEAVANEAVNLLCNLCENSDQALSVFNKSGLLDVVVQCLERHPHNVELATSAAQCLHTVSEDNPELLRSVNCNVHTALEGVLLSKESSMAHILLRTLAGGVVWNIQGSLPAARQAHFLAGVLEIISQCLDVDAGELILHLRSAEGDRFQTTPTAVGMDTQAAGEPLVEKMDEEGGAKCAKNGESEEDFSDFLPREMEELREATALLTAQQTSLEILVNMCCSDDASDDEWEERSSDGESEAQADGFTSPTCLSAEVHAALVNNNIPEKVLKKTHFPYQEAIKACQQTPHWKILITKMRRVQSRSLTCLHSILSGMDAESLGGETALQQAAQHLSALVFGAPEIPQDEEFLEAVISAMRSLLQMAASKNIPLSISLQQLMKLSETAALCDVTSVRVNAVAILGITGSALAKEKGSGQTLQTIGKGLLQVATNEADLVVNGEALDALFDVFADGEEAETAAKSIQLLPALKLLQPVFKAKIRKVGKNKYSPQQLCVLDNVRINLRRFIGYLETVDKN